MRKDVDFLYEMGTARFIPRTWMQFLNKGLANVSEHTFRVMWIAVIIATRERADVGKVMKMALVHDIAETRTGDVHYLSRMYTKRDEESAIKDILGETSAKEFLDVWKEYEARECIEAKIVKDADNIDCDFEIREQGGWNLPKSFAGKRHIVRDQIFTETAKHLWDELQVRDPHAWHMEGNNRFNNGDWKP